MECASCGAPLKGAECLYCGKVDKELFQEGANQPPQLNQQHATGTSTMPVEDQAQKPNKEQAIIKFVLCFFLGYFGVHYFYEKRIGLGLLYLFTGGLFGFGWFIDCIRLLISMIKALS